MMQWSSRFGIALAIGSTFGFPHLSAGQTVPPAAPRVISPDLPGLVGTLADQLSSLSKDLGAEVQPAAAGQVLARDTTELAQAVSEYGSTLNPKTDRFLARRAFSGIDASWNYLESQLRQPSVASADIRRDLDRIDQLEDKIHQSLGANPTPSSYYGATTAPTGLIETRRLSNALFDRAEALVADIRADIPGDVGTRLLQGAVSVAQMADAFHDGIDLTSSVHLARTGFAGISVVMKSLSADINAVQITPRVRAAWNALVYVEVLLRQNLGLSNEPGAIVGAAVPADGALPLGGLADQLVQQLDQFINVFTPNAGQLPQGAGDVILDDARRLQLEATSFRQSAAQGLNAGQLAFEFREVDALWRRLARRAGRIDQNLTGGTLAPIGQTCAQLHQRLGIPGYSPMVAPASRAD